jgi:hypothetical protein
LYHLKISERGTTSVNLVAKKLLVSIIVNHMYIGYNRRGLVTECEGYFRILSVWHMKLVSTRPQHVHNFTSKRFAVSDRWC